jgi:hypothetical protein
MTIRTSVESARGCGYRKAGGYYLVAPDLSEPCERLPLELDRCPHCGQGVGPARGFTWITPAVLFPAETHGSYEHNARCPLGLSTSEVGIGNPFVHRTGERAGLIWVGVLYYPTAESFMEEAVRMGVSRRIQKPPRNFKVGEHWIYLGHAKAFSLQEYVRDAAGNSVNTGGAEWHPGVITLFKPTELEYIVKGDETDEEIEALEKRGISPVKVIRDIDVEEGTRG